MTSAARRGDYTTENPVRHGERVSRALTRRHYENFTVGAFFLPRRIRQDLFNVYAFCRLADDIADEPAGGAGPAERLNRWERELDAAHRGSSDDPIFAALGETINRRGLSPEPFRRLLQAFRLDLVKTRWQSWDELRGYTRLSADPVGRIVLELFGYRDPDFFALSDKICTALQLANHWQDVAEDWERGRLYIPQEDLHRFGVSEEEIACRQVTDGFRELMTFEVDRAGRLFHEGRALLRMVRGVLTLQLNLYWNGGMAALEAVSKIGYDVLNRSARLGPGAKFKVAWASAVKWLLPVW